jgi:hypothetical protein
MLDQHRPENLWTVSCSTCSPPTTSEVGFGPGLPSPRLRSAPAGAVAGRFLADDGRHGLRRNAAAIRAGRADLRCAPTPPICPSRMPAFDSAYSIHSIYFGLGPATPAGASARPGRAAC